MKTNKNDWSYSLFMEIKNIFIKKIQSGDWQKGYKLPSKKDLSKRLSIDIKVINQVINALELQGYIKIIANKGMFVSDLKINYYFNSQKSVLESLQQANLMCSKKLLEWKIIDLPTSLAWQTGLLANEKYLYIEYLQYLDNNRLALEKNYLPAKIINEKLKKDIEVFGISKALIKNDIKIDNSLKTLEMTNINYNDAKSLKIDVNSLVLLQTMEATLQDKTILYTQTLLQAQAFRFYNVLEGKDHVMSESNILLTRIDNRLVHGQVGVTWTKTIGANLIVVADDNVVKDPLQQSLMSVTAKSSGVGIRFFSLQHTADIIEKASPRQKIFIVVKTPREARKLVELGVNLNKVNVGNMHFSEGKVALTKKIYVNDQDLEDLKFIAHAGIEVYCQDVPGGAIEVIK